MSQAAHRSRPFLRILYLVADYGSVNAGGIATYVHSIASLLAADGHQVEVLSPHVARFDPPRVPYRITKLEGGSQRTNRLALSHRFAEAVEARADSIDIVEATDWGMEGFHVLQRTTAPCVIRFHTPSSKVEELNDEVRRQDSAEVRTVEAEYFASTRYLSAPSQAMIRLVGETWSGVADITHLPNPLLSPKKRVAKAASQQRCFGFLGRLERRKGVYELAEALSVLLPQCPDFHFFFAGPDTRHADSSVGRDLRDLLSGVEDRVHFTGFLDDARRLEFLNLIECAVFPSLWENAPYACVEAMVAGLPIIATAGSGFEELTGLSECVTLVPPGDGRGLRGAMRHRYRSASATVEYEALHRLSWESLREPTIDFYRRAAGA